MAHQNLIDYLVLSLERHGLEVNSCQGKIVWLKKGYAIEAEGNNLYKLSHDQQVIAPFSDVDELCDFIKMDMQLNEEN